MSESGQNLEMSMATRADLVAEIQRELAEREKKGSVLEKELMELYKQTEMMDGDKKLRQMKEQCRKEDAETMRLIGEIRAALEMSKEAQKVFSAPILTIKRNQVTDPIQQNKINMVKKMANIWTNKQQQADKHTNDGHTFPPLASVFKLKQ